MGNDNLGKPESMLASAEELSEARKGGRGREEGTEGGTEREERGGEGET